MCIKMRQCSYGDCVKMRLLPNGEVDEMRQCYIKSFNPYHNEYSIEEICLQDSNSEANALELLESPDDMFPRYLQWYIGQEKLTI